MLESCDEIARRLSSGADPFSPELAGHVAGCARCASWAESVAALDAVWAATRPVEPSAEVFRRVWGRVDARPAVLPFRTVSGWRRLAQVAAAAAILIGLGLVWRLGLGGGGSGLAVAPAPAPGAALTPVAYQFEAEAGETWIVHIAPDGRIEADIRDPAGTSETITVAAEFEILNFMESQAADAL